MKYGFTTGSAATAAAKAALLYMITGKEKEVMVQTPSGAVYIPSVYGLDCKKKTDGEINTGDLACCYVLKESGDDPDITSGMEIHAKVTVTDSKEIIITGGRGIGKVTRPGLDQPVGEFAINSVPRKMITEAVRDLLFEHHLECGVEVEISAPEGEEISKKTFNPHMGIEGGISIIGTSGIVKPMSTEALLETIRLDINMQYQEGQDTCVIVPGNYGVTFLENNYHISEKEIVLCSNYVGDSMKFAVNTGFKKILFCSHIGKMIKVSGGVMNTHSMYGDRRMEFMWDAVKEVIDRGLHLDEFNIDECNVTKLKERIMDCVSTTAALNIIEEYGMIKSVSDVIVTKTKKYLEQACSEKASVDVILYENSYGELARSF